MALERLMEIGRKYLLPISIAFMNSSNPDEDKRVEDAELPITNLAYEGDVISGDPLEEANIIIHDSLDNSLLNLLLETSNFSPEEWRKYSYGSEELSDLLDNAIALVNLGFTAREIIDYSKVGETVSFAARISDLFDATGYDIYRYRRANIFNDSADYINFAEELASIRYKDQQVFTSGYDLLRATWLDVSIETAENLAVLGHNAEEILQLIFLNEIGLSLDFRYPEFVDTNRPNLRIVMPYYDKNGAFSHPHFLNFLRNIVPNYDARVTFASTEEMVFPYIGKDNSTIIAGHGNPEGIQLGGPNRRYFVSDERWRIDISDEELSRFSSLPKNSVVILVSCRTAFEFETRNTLGTDISNYLGADGNRMIFAPTGIISINYPGWVSIDSENPLIIAFYNNRGENITFTNIIRNN